MKNIVFQFYLGDKTYSVNLINADKQQVRAEIDGVQYAFNMAEDKTTIFVHNEQIGNIPLIVKERFPVKAAEKIAGGYETPMPSQIIKILVQPGQKVSEGEGLVVLSSMKMENTVEATQDGVVSEIYAKEGSNVPAGFLLLKLGEEES